MFTFELGIVWSMSEEKCMPINVYTLKNFWLVKNHQNVRSSCDFLCENFIEKLQGYGVLLLFQGQQLTIVLFNKNVLVYSNFKILTFTAYYSVC